MPTHSENPPAAAARELVVALHGLNCTGRSMSRLAAGFERNGYRAINPTYPSRTMPIEEIASVWLPKILRKAGADTAPRVHFVTHSMGGIIVRLWLRDCPAPANLGRIVMIAPPNHGSEVPDRLLNNSFLRFMTSANGCRLGTKEGSLPRALGDCPEYAEVGIIAGDHPLNPLFSAWFGGPSDGTVSVESTHLAGMRDHIVMPHSHSLIVLRKAVAAQSLHFLREGKFAA